MKQPTLKKKMNLITALATNPNEKDKQGRCSFRFGKETQENIPGVTHAVI